MNWIVNGQTTRFAHLHPDLSSALEFACEGFAIGCSDVWVVDENGQRVADRVSVAQHVG